MNKLYIVIKSTIFRVVRILFSGVLKKLDHKLRLRIASELSGDLGSELLSQRSVALRKQIKSELAAELKLELWPQLVRQLQIENSFEQKINSFVNRANLEIGKAESNTLKTNVVTALSKDLRKMVREAAGVVALDSENLLLSDLILEVSFLQRRYEVLAPAFKALTHTRVLYAGQAYYNAWYLSRGLRQLGWQADVLNWDTNASTQIYYHGQDYLFKEDNPSLTEDMLGFYVSALYRYDIFHFSNAHGIGFGWPVQNAFKNHFSLHEEIFLLKLLGKKIVYSNNGCQDGVSQSEFSKWGPVSVCSICRWQNEPSVCSDQRNLEWGAFRNAVADYQCLLGGNRVDYNDDPRVHEVPEFYCLEPDIWNPKCEIPEQYRLPALPVGGVRLYHAVGHKADRTRDDGVNIKSSHIYLPLVEKLKDEGLSIDLIEASGIPNIDVRFLQMQADIFLEMLTFGWFGANAREAMMLGKPVICFIRPEWLDSVRCEIPEYADELPIINATPDSVESILRELIADGDKRRSIGERSRQFALKWHSTKVAAARFDRIYNELLFSAGEE